MSIKLTNTVINEEGASKLVGMRDGTEIEKGVVITEEYLEKNFDKICKLLEIFSAYPDIFLDMIKPADDEFSLFLFQRITLRAVMRYREVYGTAPRALNEGAR